MIVDSHMHVGDFPMFNVSMDRDALVDEMRTHDVATGFVFQPGAPSAINLGHMGHGNIIDINGAIDVAARNPNVYLETSGIPMHSKIREAVERMGPDRVLYGSDTPFHHPSVELAKVRVSGLSTDLTERVLGENSRRLFFGEQAPEAVV